MKSRLINNTGNNGTVNVEIPVLLKYLSNLWRSLEMPLINCEIILEVIWSANFAIYVAEREKKFAMTDAKFYVPVVTLSTEDNAKLFYQLKPGFKRTIKWHKYLSKVKIFPQSSYLHYLICIIIWNEDGREGHSGYYLPKVEIIDCNVKIDGGNFFDQPINSNIKTFDNTWETATGQEDDYSTGGLLDYPYFKKNC